MTPSDVSADVLEELRALWRMRAALAFFRSAPGVHVYVPTSLSFERVPTVLGTDLFAAPETVGEALSSVAAYENDRMTADALLVILTPLERFLVYFLKSAGASNFGTLGQLQRAAQSRQGIQGGVEVTLMDEVRERRNCLIHDHGVVSKRYCDAANAAAPLSSGEVLPSTAGTQVVTTWQYLSYAAGVVNRYATLYS